MSRLVLLVVLGIVAMAYFPESRRILLETAEPVVTPVLRWQANHELEQVVRELRMYERENYGRLPEARRFPDWIDSRLDFEGSTDPWGTPYVLYQQRDSFAVVSFGPDRLPGTGDEIRFASKKARPDGG